MAQPDVLIVGAGPAGMATAAELARLGLSAWLVEQRDQMGGAIYRRAAGGAACPVALPAHHRRLRDELARGISEAGERIVPMLQSVLVGVDRDGRFLIDDRRGVRVLGVVPKAVVLAVGTVERVLPREGWELPGVVTAGGMQVQLKETGEAPAGPVLLAGNGPLLLALAAQLTAAGNRPLAVLERSRSLAAAWRHGSAVLDVLRCRPHVSEAMTYASRLLRAGVPYRTGWNVQSIRPEGAELLVSCLHHAGATQQYRVRHLALHDGLTPNSTGLPAADALSGGVIERAGDCREVLGAAAAIQDGRRAAQTVARTLGRADHDERLERAIAAARRTQGALAQLFKAPAIEPSANTVICRCEGLRRADFERLQNAGSARELRLVGRFGMGACQGRFCAHTLSELAHGVGTEFDPTELNGEIPRWPLRPVSLAALANYTELDP